MPPRDSQEAPREPKRPPRRPWQDCRRHLDIHTLSRHPRDSSGTSPGLLRDLSGFSDGLSLWDPPGIPLRPFSEHILNDFGNDRELAHNGGTGSGILATAYRDGRGALLAHSARGCLLMWAMVRLIMRSSSSSG